MATRSFPASSRVNARRGKLWQRAARRRQLLGEATDGGYFGQIHAESSQRQEREMRGSTSKHRFRGMILRHGAVTQEVRGSQPQWEKKSRQGRSDTNPDENALIFYAPTRRCVIRCANCHGFAVLACSNKCRADKSPRAPSRV